MIPIRVYKSLCLSLFFVLTSFHIILSWDMRRILRKDLTFSKVLFFTHLIFIYTIFVYFYTPFLGCSFVSFLISHQLRPTILCTIKIKKENVQKHKNCEMLLVRNNLSLKKNFLANFHGTTLHIRYLETVKTTDIWRSYSLIKITKWFISNIFCEKSCKKGWLM